MRSWLRPRLRYGSVSTMPFARSAAATADASTASAKSIVPTTCERWAGSATNGVAYGDFSAHVYRRDDESAVRAVVQARPPWASIHATCSASSSKVATDGVLEVWFLAELSMARGSDRKPGM